MTFKQLLRKLFAELWHRCAKLAEHKIELLGYHHQDQAAWWESFLIRCEKRALYHSQFVPSEAPQAVAASSSPSTMCEGLARLIERGEVEIRTSSQSAASHASTEEK